MREGAKQTCLYFIISVSDVTDVSFVLKLIH